MPASTTPKDGLLDTWGRRNRKLSDRECKHCGTTFKPPRSTSGYCSVPCARKKNGGHNRKPETWWKDSKGYIQGRVRLASGEVLRVKQHRWLMERHLGRILLPHEDIHHINGVKDDNRIENLQVVSHRDHSRITNSSRDYKSGYKLRLSDDEREARSIRAKRRAQERRTRAAIAKAEGREA